MRVVNGLLRRNNFNTIWPEAIFVAGDGFEIGSVGQLI
jgi:hypothetical protein